MEHKCARMGVSGFATPHLLSRYFRGSRRRLGCVWEEKEISSTPSLPLIGRIGVSARTRSDQDCQRRRHSQCCCLGRLPAHAAPKIIKSHHSPRPPLSRVLRGSPDRRPYVSSTYVRPLFSLLYPTTSQLHPPVHRPITHTLGLAPWTQRSLQPKTINRPFPFLSPPPPRPLLRLSQTQATLFVCVGTEGSGSRQPFATRAKELEHVFALRSLRTTTSLLPTKTRNANTAVALPVAVAIRSFVSV